MKSAIYIEDGLTQVVLSPENNFDIQALAQLDSASTVKIARGTFYRCQGGWMREGTVNDSVMLLCERPPTP